MAEVDPFSLGDSDDEREAKTKDIKPEDTERLQKAAAEAMADDIGASSKGGLVANPKAGPEGTRDKEVEERLVGKS